MRKSTTTLWRNFKAENVPFRVSRDILKGKVLHAALPITIYISILALQIATIRYELDDHHTYDFVEGAIPHPIAPGLSDLVPLGTETYAYADATSATSCAKAFTDVEAYVTECGPFDGVIKDEGSVFKCAIFFSGGIPGDPQELLTQQKIRLLNSVTDREVIKIPTAHIWGSNDTLYPEFEVVLRSLCKKDLREEYVHEGVHEIPRPGDKVAVANAVRIIRRTIDRALTLQ
ncbi:d41963eb-867d-44ba-8217-4ef0002a5171 [Sclerotinia trifoliorum]|uniref:D41963eb-867d-44ba-8217-4ef0002a5171 n=1 Tax=Sclerotinia trifoliorum TaxID=28548 RepID=A0A8H2ZSP6_9HELO|nr:d41963eb-867d-44ba-8217-4ef0002a5171 [Sclerotinia trifoliorum]